MLYEIEGSQFAAQNFGGTVEILRDFAVYGEPYRDGRPEFAISSSEDANGLQSPGTVRVFSGRDATVVYTFHGTQSSSEFGAAVVGAHDLDGLGGDDIVIGAPGHNGGAGAVFAFSSETGNQIFQITGAPNERFGASIEDALDDVNRNGTLDILVGAPNYNNGDGRACVIEGRNGTMIYCVNGSAGERMGTVVHWVIDVNGDSRNDFLAGAPGAQISRTNLNGSFQGTGRIVAISHSARSVFRSWEANAAFSGDFGSRFDRTSGTGTHDHIVVYSPLANNGNGVIQRFNAFGPSPVNPTSPTYVPGSHNAQQTITWNMPNHLFASSVRLARPIQPGNGLSDIAVGAPGLSHNDPGKILFFSSTDPGPTSFMREFGGSDQFFGEYISEAKDYFVIGSPSSSGGSGKAYAYKQAYQGSVGRWCSSGFSSGYYPRIDGTGIDLTSATYDVSIQFAPPFATGLLYFSLVPNLPSQILGCDVFVDLGTLSGPTVFTADFRGRWSFPTPLLTTVFRNFLGESLAAQAAFVWNSRLLTTDGFRMVIH